VPTPNLYRFSSKFLHPNSGLYYHGYRFYDPNVQRWLNRDPAADAGFLEKFRSGLRMDRGTRAYRNAAQMPETRQGPNLYGFVRNRPVSAVDPCGLWGVKVCDFGYGDPSYDFDFDKNDWQDLKDQYRCNARVLFWWAAAATKSAQMNPNPAFLATGVAADGFFLGTIVGYSICNFWEEFSDDVEE
jgi:hypothetical protein